jgi:outer membrane beta-barrel protein
MSTLFDRKSLFLWSLVIWAPAAFAQSGMSDLEEQMLLGNPSSSGDADEAVLESAPSKSKNDEVEDEKAQEPEVDEDDLEELDEAIAGPQRIPHEQIFVVQRRYIKKEERHELTPLTIGFQPADSFRRQVQWGFSYAYYINEWLGIEALHAAFVTNHSTGLDETIDKSASLKTDFGVVPVVILGSTIQVTPFRSKAATRENVYHFETYFLGGGGMSFAETANEGIGMLGVGFRAFLSQRGLVKVEMRDYIQFSGSSKNRLSFVVGGGILL